MRKLNLFALDIYTHAAATSHEFHTNLFRRNKLATRHIELSCIQIILTTLDSGLEYFYPTEFDEKCKILTLFLSIMSKR